MTFTAFEQINIGVSLVALLGSAYFGVRKTIQRKNIVELETFYTEAMKTNLNQISIKKQKDISQQVQKYILHRPVSIQKVRAHFMDNSPPTINFISDKYDDFPKVDCSPFYIVEKTLNKSSYQLYKVNVRQALVSQNVIIPNVGNQEASKSLSSSTHYKILTSASTLGIIGTLSLSSDSSAFTINARIIGVDLRQIQKYISDQKLYNTFGIILSGIGVILGAGWLVKTYREIMRKRVPLEASLLQTSNIRR